MRLPLALVAMLLLAGCAGTTEAPAATGPVKLPRDQLGLVLVDTQEGTHLLVSPASSLGWMSRSGATVVYQGEEAYFVILDMREGSVQPAAQIVWSRVEDDGTGVLLQPQRAVRAVLANGSEIGSVPLPAGPRPDGTWSGIAEDASILAAEWPGFAGNTARCQNVVAIRDQAKGEDVTRTGCHVRVARDGRVGWTQATGVWVREANGTLRDVTGSGRQVNGTYVSHENPLFPAEGLVYLRLTGQQRLAKTEVVTEEGKVLAVLEDDARLALLDVSDDARFVLLRIFSG